MLIVLRIVLLGKKGKGIFIFVLFTGKEGYLREQKIFSISL